MNYKKGISLGLVLSLVLGGNVSAFSSTEDLLTLIKERKLEVSTLQEQISEEEDLQCLKKTDEVRVIVEMEESAVIETATSKGINLEEMSKSELLKLQGEAEKVQEKVHDKIEAKGITFEESNSFTNVINGFSGTTTLENAEKIDRISGVKSVTIVNEYERPIPEMNNSNEFTKAIETLANGYEGEGMVISIIDTGIDSSHKDMKLDDTNTAKIQEAKVTELINKNNLLGEFFTYKVPYGYNYMDKNNEIIDLYTSTSSSMHGMHVAGIAAANGEIKGTAPEAQLLAMKVFGNKSSTYFAYGDVIIKAIDDSVALGADVINISLGSTAAFVDDEDPEQAAVNRAVDNGVLVSISAGNSAAFGGEGYNPYASNPDYGVVGSPGLATDSLQVASIDNNVLASSGEMSSFTSWGTTPDLELKPEITGVGGNVLSTANNNGYKTMSGTSMAAPNVSGGAALVLEMLQAKYPDLTGEAKALRAKNILMSTASPNVEKSGYFTSPRRQGAGVMNLKAATSTPGIVTELDTGISKVTLKEIEGDKALFNIKVENFSDKEIAYNISGTVQTDCDDKGHITLTPQGIVSSVTKKVPIAFSNNSIKVPAKGSTKVTVTIDLKNTVLQTGKKLEDVFINGGYVEGFVILKDMGGINPQLSIPYVGFKGEWDKAPNIDPSIYDKKNSSFYGYTAMMSPSPNKSGSYIYLGLPYDAKKRTQADGNFIDFSPNGDDEIDVVAPMLSYLRNIKEMKIEILDSKGNVLRTIGSQKKLRKHYNDGVNQIYSILQFATWNGKINGSVAEDGTYIYRIATKIDYEGAKWQYNDFKINLDNTSPRFKNYVIDEVAKTLTINAEDNFNGHIYGYILVTPITQETEEKAVINSTGVFDISKELAAGISKDNFVVGLVDYAQNLSKVVLSQESGTTQRDEKAPVVRITSPEVGQVFNGTSVVFKGTITDESSIEDFTINGGKPQITYDSTEKVWKFSHSLTLKDGYHNIYINAKDSGGNKSGIYHKVFVDTKNPIIVASYIDPITTASVVKIKAKLTDNFPDLKVSINGVVIKNISNDWQYFNELKPAAYELNYEYKLQPGVNNIVLKVSDKANNVVTKEFRVEKVADMAIKTKELAGANRYETAVKVSKGGWTNSPFAVIANGTAYVDALVAAPLAALYKAPILLSERDVLTPSTLKELQRLGVKEVFVVGGTGVISNGVATKLNNLGMKVTRIGGADRYDTSLRVAKHIEKEKAITKVYVVGGQAIPDAVTISPKAAEEISPIMLVESKAVGSAILTWFSDAKVTAAHVIGGTGVVNDTVLNKLSQINNKAVKVDRTAGENRYSTNAAVIDRFYETYEEKVMVTESNILVDALVVAPYAAKYGAPIVITEESLSAEQKAVMDKMIAKEVVKIGGTVSNKVMKDIAGRLNK